MELTILEKLKIFLIFEFITMSITGLFHLLTVLNVIPLGFTLDVYLIMFSLMVFCFAVVYLFILPVDDYLFENC